jgi:hypothetical protein
MAKYSKKAQDKVKKAMHERKHGTLKSGSSGKKVKSRKQAIAIGLSEARREGAKAPKKKGAGSKPGPKKKTASRSKPGPKKGTGGRKPGPKKGTGGRKKSKPGPKKGSRSSR